MQLNEKTNKQAHISSAYKSEVFISCSLSWQLHMVQGPVDEAPMLNEQRPIALSLEAQI